MDFYEIQIPPRRINRSPPTTGHTSRPSRFVVEAPPPFSTAYLVSSPVFHPDDLPPPTYEESLRNQPIGGVGVKGQPNAKDISIHM